MTAYRDALIEELRQFLIEWKGCVDFTFNERGLAVAERAADRLMRLAGPSGRESYTAEQLVDLIEDHNQQCKDACDWRAKNQGHCAYRKTDGAYIYGKKNCSDCPRDWEIELATSDGVKP